MANTSKGITSTPTPTANGTSAKKLHINWPSTQTVVKSFWRFFTLLGKAGAGAIVFFALAHFVPELRVEMPNFYKLVDFAIDTIEWVYTHFWAIIT